ncbi:MAG TPA: hypothetical protein VGC93_00650 [Thermoanaerobaculia bacterium]
MLPHAGKMVAFASLWLGVVAGNVPVELLVPPDTARVELFLDGRPAGVLAAAPWKLPVDIGEELAPHELVAVATDAAGGEIGRARQWLNLPQPPAVLEVTLETDPETGGVARVAWAAVGGAQPLQVRATLDEQPLPAGDPAVVTLPPFAAESPHLLRVEAEFPDGYSARRDLVFGGVLAEELTFELTHVPVLLEGKRLASEIVVLGGGERLAPIAVEEGEADLVVVLDPSAREELGALAREVARMGTMHPGARGLLAKVDGRFVAPLPAGTGLRVMWPVARRTARQALRWQVFAHTQELPAREGGLLWHLLRLGDPTRKGAPALTDAVAVAGLAAAQNTRRRAVLLILGPAPQDMSLYAAAAVRRYLERLRVPLHVWTIGKGDAPAAWGEVERVRNLAGFERAMRRLSELLERQRIVWVAGAHLPQSLALAPEVQGVLPLGTLGSETAAEEPDEAEAVEVAAAADLVPAPVPSVAAPALAVPAGLAAFAAGAFTLHTDLEDRAAVAALKRTALALPQIWADRFGVAPTGILDGALLVFRRDEDFRAFVRGQGEELDRGVRGSARGGRVALAAAGQPAEEVTALFVHELAHLLSRRAFGRELPPWLEEGLAEELALARQTRSGAIVPGTLRGRVRARALDASSSRPNFASRFEVSADGAYGALSALLNAQRSGAAPSLAELLALPHAAFTRFEGRRERYTASAFFVRFLLDGRERRARERFHAFLGAVARGGAADAEALTAALGEPLALLERDYLAWLRLQATVNR